MLDEQEDEDKEVMDDSVENCCFSLASFRFFACTDRYKC